MAMVMGRIRLRRAAEILAVSPFSLADRRWRKRHAIPAVKIGRAVIFDVRQLEEYLATRQEGARAARRNGVGTA